jgi:hypothetical protein
MTGAASPEIARSAGLGRDAVQRKDRVRSDRTQRRLREMVEVINRDLAGGEEPIVGVSNEAHAASPG